MKLVLQIEDTVTPHGPDVEIKLMSDPAITDNEPQTRAHQLALLALGVVDSALNVGRQMSEDAVKIHDAMAVAKGN